MTVPIPAALKSADISRFAHRAAQLETAKPVVAYWCEYWIVNQILSKELHNVDHECLVYTTSLMDKLEQFKSENQANDAVTDDMAGKAYVEQFGLETFSRADNAIRANKASRQTADTFQASATFLDLLQIWGPIEAELVAKIKYAKYHALRIAKALKAGEDPNLSNPVQEPEPEEALPELDPNDVDVQMLNGGPSHPRQPSVVEVPDETHRVQGSLAQRSSLDESLHPSRASSVPRAPGAEARQPSVADITDDTDRLQSHLAPQSSINESLHPSRASSTPQPAIHDISPLAVPTNPPSFLNDNTFTDAAISPISTSADRKSSIGGNYFPQVPSPPTDAPSTSLPSAPPDPDISTPFDLPVVPSEPSLPQPPTAFTPPQPHIPPLPRHQPSPPPPARHHGTFLPPQQPIPPNFIPDPAPRQPLPQAPPQLRQPLRQPQVIAPAQAYATPAAAQSMAKVEIDEEAVMKAQKHARWAISALNFEDVPTAIKELRGALQTLGAL